MQCHRACQERQQLNIFLSISSLSCCASPPTRPSPRVPLSHWCLSAIVFLGSKVIFLAAIAFYDSPSSAHDMPGPRGRWHWPRPRGTPHCPFTFPPALFACQDCFTCNQATSRSGAPSARLSKFTRHSEIPSLSSLFL